MPHNIKPTIVVMLPVNDIAQLSEVMHQHSFAILGTNASVKEIKRAIEDVLAGEQFISTHLSKSLLTELNKIAQQNKSALFSPALTARENEIALLIATGFKTGEIAAQLNISENTVGTHRKNILKKLGLKNSASLTNHLHKHNLK